MGLHKQTLAPSRLPALVAFLFPSLARLGTGSPFQLLERLFLWPLELYESVAIVPVRFLRRHLPIVGGTLVVLMTLQGIVLRLFLDMLHAIFARITYSRDPVFNYHSFWLAMQDRYAFFELRGVDWGVVHQLFGDPLQTTTNEEDLWIALQESVAMTDDPALRVTRVKPGSHGAAPGITTATTAATATASSGFTASQARGRPLLTSACAQLEDAALDVMERRHLTDGGRQISNRFVYGILNAETSPGWRIGYISLTAMEGFVDFPLPRLDALVPSMWPHGSSSSSSSSTVLPSSRVVVPEIYDLESMRWALEAILRSLGDVDGLILDLRFNGGGGSLASPLAVASFFSSGSRGKHALAFMTDERLPCTHHAATPQRFSRKQKYYVPRAARGCKYSGPLVVLQGPHTRGTAELLVLSLMTRPNTCRIGAATAGSLSQTQKLRLPNSWAVEIPHMRCMSADGSLYEGQGIPAEKHVENMEEALLEAVRESGDDHDHDHDGDGVVDREYMPRDVFDPCIKKAIEHVMLA